MLVNEKPYNPYKCKENTILTFLSGQQKLCFAYCQGEQFPAQNARKEILKKYLCCYLYLKNKKHHISICEEIQRLI